MREAVSRVEASLDAASQDVAMELARFTGVFDTLTAADLGEQEFQLDLRPEARSLDISLDDLLVSGFSSLRR